MPAKLNLTRALLCAAAFSIANGCSTPARVHQTFPSAADLAIENKPLPGVDTLTSETAADAYDAKLEAWGERGWLALGRVCRQLVAIGMPGVTCPARPAGAPR